MPTYPIRDRQESMQWMLSDLLDGLDIHCAHIIGNSNSSSFARETTYLLPSWTKEVALIGSEHMGHDVYDWPWQGLPREPAEARLDFIAVVAGHLRCRPSNNMFALHVFRDAEPHLSLRKKVSWNLSHTTQRRYESLSGECHGKQGSRVQNARNRG